MSNHHGISLPEDLAHALPSFPADLFGAAVMLGSGLGNFADHLTIHSQIPTSELPGYPTSTVAGHEGSLLLAEHSGKTILLFKGRIHGYEGYSGQATTLPAGIAAALGAKTLILTNAAGGLAPTTKAGDLMLITDVVVPPAAPRMGMQLHGHADEWRQLPRPLFPDSMLELARQAARESRVGLREGTYGFCSGPTYETRSEIAFFRSIGIDAAGMSTVPEIMHGVRAGLDVIGISCITNKALTVRQVVTHEEVTTVAAAVSETFSRLLLAIISRL